ncbi:unnamed protein product [Adineta ricciae]|uniref:Uncharacterized protein n=1 Tax=Adineta ricciae TaxID=249248 RepID=A0A815FML2_ADIRI|nr:unnamed protein product [Adineta ricciae]
MGPHSSKHHHRRGSTPAKSDTLYPPRLAPTKSDSSISVRKYDLSSFAVIAVIFNPMKYKSRYNHYNKFQAHMAQSGVTLFTVECIFESAERFGLSSQQFELTKNGDWRHIQVIAPSILWMKENLINIALKYLPQHFEYVAWVDADIEFESLDWPHRTIAELQQYSIVQIFELSYFLGPGGKSDVLRRDYSLGYSIRKNKPIDPRRYDEWYPHPGYAWAMRRSAMNAIGGLIDFCIIGSGDLHFAFALIGRIEETLRPGLHHDYRQLALAWGQRVAEQAQNGAKVGYVPVNVYHHWHGERKDRNYIDRWAILERHQFSPINDLEKNNDTGLIRLANKSHLGQLEVQRMEMLERDIVAYFQSRNEDKKTKTTSHPQPPPPVKSTPSKPSKPLPSRATGGGLKPTKFNTPYSTRPPGYHIWSSGPSGSHVDDHNPYLDQCTCPGHCHHPDNHDCPCAPHHMDDQHCWPSTDCDDHDHHHHHGHDDQHCGPSTDHDYEQHHHHHHDHDHHHHGYDHHTAICPPSDHHGHGSHPDTYLPSDNYDSGHHSTHDHGHHGGYDNDYSYGGGEHHDSDYNGPGSFY